MDDPTDAPTQTPSPYNRFFVVKVSGKALTPDVVEGLAAQLKALLDAGHLPVVVHGAGGQLTEALDRAGIPSEFKDGLRVTPPEALDVALSVFSAEGKKLASALSAAGVPALALNGYDAGLLTADVKDGGALGRVGDVTGVEADLLRFLAYNGLVPVVGPPAVGPDGEGLNVNADEAASAVAAWLPAAHLVLLTDVPGVLGADGAPIARLTVEEALSLKEATGGMAAKVHAAAKAARMGVPRVLIAGFDASLAGLADGDGAAAAEATATAIVADGADARSAKAAAAHDGGDEQPATAEAEPADAPTSTTG